MHYAGEAGPRVKIRFEKALLVYKKSLDRPVFQVSLRDAWGEALQDIVETPPCHYENGIFQAGHVVSLSYPVQKMPEGRLSLPASSFNSLERRFLVWSQ